MINNCHNNLYILIMCVCLAYVVSCTSTDSSKPNFEHDTEYLPVMTHPDGRWGLMSVDGQILFEDEFKDCPTPVVNGIFSVNEDGGVSLYEPNLQPRLVGECTDLADAGVFNDGRMPIVHKNGRISVVDKNGDEVFVLGPIGDKEVLTSARCFSDGLLVFGDDTGLYGCYDTDGVVRIPAKYAYLSVFNGGYAIAMTPENKYIIVNDKGEEVSSVHQGYKVVSDAVVDKTVIVTDTAGILGFMNLAGEIDHLPAKVKSVGEFNRDILVFQSQNGFWGIMNRKLTKDVLMRPKFGSVQMIDGGDAFLVELDGKWSVTDIHGKHKLTFADGTKIVKAVDYPGDIRYLAQDNAGWVMMDEKGCEINHGLNIYGIGLKTMGDGVMQSRCFDTNEFIAKVLGLITLNSMNGIQLNALANRHYADLNPEDYVDTTEFTPTDQPESGFGYNISVVGVTDRGLTSYKYNRQTNTYESQFAPNNVVYAIELVITSKQKNLYDNVKEALIKGLLEKGFRMVEQEDGVVTMQSNYANIEMGPLESEPGMSILMYKL